MLNRLKLKRGLLVSCELLIFFSAGLSVNAAEVLDRRNECSEWVYDANGGFEGGLPTAMLLCSSDTEFQDIPLQISCVSEGITIRYFGALGQSIPPAVSPVTINYKFDNNVFFPEQAIYEAGPGDWASYTPSDTGLLDAFARKSYVEITTSATEEIERLALEGSFTAIQQMQEACLGITE